MNKIMISTLAKHTWKKQKTDGSLLFNYLIILGLKKYKGNEFMSIYSSTILIHPLCIHSPNMNIALS